MILMVALSGIFWLTVLLAAVPCLIPSGKHIDTADSFLPKSRTEMIKGIAAIGIVFSHIASYSKGSAPSGLLRYYNVFLTTLGGVGVNLFFFLSGYGNYFSAVKNRKNWKDWLWKRCATLLIVYAICLVLVLGVLYMTGYQITVRGILREVLCLTIPYSSVWYVKIQLLAYVFLILAIFLKKRKHQTLTVAVLCLLSSVILFSFGLDEKWWKSTMCFAAGVFCAAYLPEVKSAFLRHKRAVLLGSIGLFPVAYVSAVLIDVYLVKTLGNLVLCMIMMALVELLQMESKGYYKLGCYSLPLYLAHRSLVAWFLDDGVTTVSKVVMIVVYSALLTVAAKWISDKCTTRLIGKNK